MVQSATYQGRECLRRKVLDEVEKSCCVAVTLGLVWVWRLSLFIAHAGRVFKGGKRFFAEESHFIARKWPHIISSWGS